MATTGMGAAGEPASGLRLRESSSGMAELRARVGITVTCWGVRGEGEPPGRKGEVGPALGGVLHNRAAVGSVRRRGRLLCLG